MWRILPQIGSSRADPSWSTYILFWINPKWKYSCCSLYRVCDEEILSLYLIPDILTCYVEDLPVQCLTCAMYPYALQARPTIHMWRLLRHGSSRSVHRRGRNHRLQISQWRQQLSKVQWACEPTQEQVWEIWAKYISISLCCFNVSVKTLIANMYYWKKRSSRLKRSNSRRPTRHIVM
jgi:hypothetical protein